MVAGVVLAAGTSSRLGRPKQLLEIEGKPLLQHILDAVATGPFDQVVVVLGHASEEIAARIHLPVGARIVVNPDFALGQSSSLRAGLRAASGETSAAVILLGDQPGVSPEAMRMVVEAWRAGDGPVVQAAYQGRNGHPTLLDRSVWPAAESAEGDEGARSILNRHREWRTTVEIGVPPPEDIDTEADYVRVKALLEGP
jgi:molybdenum cofactor cytidylyltransferase